MRSKNFGGLGNHQKHPAGCLARRPEPRWPSSQRCGWHDPWLQHRLRAPPAPRCINDVWMVYERCINGVYMTWQIHGVLMVHEWLINDWLSHFNGISPTPIWWITDFKHCKRGWWSITLNQPGCLNSPWQAFSALQIFSIPSSFNTSTYRGSEHKENVQNLNIRYRIIISVTFPPSCTLLVRRSCQTLSWFAGPTSFAPPGYPAITNIHKLCQVSSLSCGIWWTQMSWHVMTPRILCKFSRHHHHNLWIICLVL